jgi:arylsulfatase A-like enzyme
MALLHVRAGRLTAKNAGFRPGQAIPKKLKMGGYATHMVGKWHVGVQSVGQTPFGRGFDTSKHYSDGAEDHWTQAGPTGGRARH